jgi:hypothetical protein
MIISAEKLIEAFGTSTTYTSTTSTGCTLHRWTFRLKSDTIDSNSTSITGSSKQMKLDTLLTIISDTSSSSNGAVVAATASEHELVHAVANELFGTVTTTATTAAKQYHDASRQQQASSSCTRWLLHFNTENSDVVLGYLEAKVIIHLKQYVYTLIVCLHSFH